MNHQGKKILIIDDDNRNIFALAAYLRSKKIETISATSARDGLAMLEKDASIAIVLMDVMMPDMDGLEAIAYIRANEGLKSIPVIAVTAQAMVGDKEKTINAGASDYISKPVDVTLLLRLLEKYLK